MPRRIDHLVICVHDLARAEQNLRTLGFTLTPTGVHPFGTSNRLAMFGDNFLELRHRRCCNTGRRTGPFQLRCPPPEFSGNRGRDVDAGLAQRRRACRRRPLRGKWHGRSCAV
ncbi:MAG TPA: VOC family protein [Bradyrhizobium sp.]|nr:VOC family protein [Bradyrhizobium sp.]